MEPQVPNAKRERVCFFKSLQNALLVCKISHKCHHLTVCVNVIVAMLDMNISQFLKSLGLEHLRDIFEREQVSNVEIINA